MNVYSFYKITNNINGMIYYGIHIEKTWPILDDYLGSGTLLKRAIKKHGAENFSRKILCIAGTREYVADIESKIVNDKFIKESSNYNMAKGGAGWGPTPAENRWWVLSPEDRAEVKEAGRIKIYIVEKFGYDAYKEYLKTRVLP